MKKRLMSVLLALAMVITMIPTTAFAAEVSDADNDGIIHYVSLGASNTNGYGHRGYLPGEVTEDPLAASKADMNVYGYERAPKAAYPAQVAEELKRITGKDVKLHQLAISSMRTEELRVLLDDEYYGDAYTEWRFTGEQKWFEIALPGGLKALRKAYQDAIRNADLITIDIGWNNFGVYALNNIEKILADGKYWKAPVMEDILTENEQVFYGNLKEIALDYLESNAGMADHALQDKLALMADVLAYAAMGACHHFDIVLEKIYALNPDATVVSINIQNLADGLVVDFEGMKLNLDELYGKLIEMTDLYRATTCPYADRYLYADAGDVETFLDEIVAWDGDPKTLGDDTKDCFDMYDDSLYVRSIVEYMMVGQALSGVFRTVREMASEKGLPLFTNDDQYTYDFALNMAWLDGVDLGKLDLEEPDTDLEKYGAAVAQHLKNLRVDLDDVEDFECNAYDYVFEDLLADLADQKEDLEDQKGNLPEGTPQSVIDQIDAGIAQLDQAINGIVPMAKAEFEAKLKGVYKTYVNTLNYAYDVVATIVQYAASIDALEINADTLNGFNNPSKAMMALVANDFINGSMAKFNYELYANGLSKTMVNPVPDYVLDESIIAPAVRAIAVLAVRYELGNSFFAHPNTVGHDQITEAVLEALANGPFAKDYSDEQLNAAWNWLMDYAQANYPETYDVFMQVADYVGSEEFAALCVELEELYNRLDSATTPEQKARLAEETYKLLTRLQGIAAMATADKVENIDYYVSIGDSTLSGYGLEGYTIGSFNGEGQKIGNEAPILLAKKLFGEEYEDHFEKLDKGGLRTNDILVWLGLNEHRDDFYDRYTIDENAINKNTAYYQELYRTEIEKADLITLTLGGGDVSTFIEKQIIALRETGSTYALDWTKYFPEADLTEIYGYIDTITKVLDGTLPEIMGVEAEDLAPVVAESFLYGFVGYVNNYSKIVDRIHEMNPDAHIVLVGYFNTVDGMMLPVTIQGETIQLPIGAMLGMLVETSNANTLSYALAHNEYTTYVSTSEATTILDEQGIFDYESRLNGLIAQTWQTHAGPEGHKYIADQIYTAITTEYTDKEIAIAAWEALADYGKYLGDEFGDEILAALDKLMREAYAYAYIRVDEKGYIDDAADALDEVLAAVESVNVAELEIPESVKDELEEAIAIVKQDIANLKAALENDEFDTVDNLVTNGGALLGGMYSDLRALDRLAENAGIDLYNDALALCEAKMEAILECIEEMKESFHEKLEDLIAEAEDGILGEIGKLEDISLSGLKKLIADLEEQIAVINAQLETLQGYTGTEVTKLIEELQSELDEAEAYLAKLNALAEKVEDLVNEIENEPELTTEKVQAIVADAKSIVADTENLVAETQAAMVELAAVYEAVMPQLIEALQSVEGPVGEALDVTEEEIEKFAAELTAGCEKTVAAVNAAADEIDGVVAETIAAVSESVAEAVAAIEEATIEAYDEIAPAVEGTIEEIEAQTSALAQSADAEIRDAAQAILDELEKLDVDTAAYEEKLAEASEIVAALMDEAAQIETAVQAVAFLEGAETALGELAAIAEEIYALAETDVPAALSDIGLAAKNILETVNGSDASLGAAASGASAASAEAILDAVNTVVPAAQKAIGAYEAAVTTAAGEIAEAVTAAAEEIGAEAVVVLETAVEAVESIVAQGTSGAESVVEAWSKVFYDATHGELDVDCKTSYVALGSSVAYAEELADLLGAYITLSTDEADLAEADLVTIGVDTADMVADIEGKIVYMVAEFIKSEPQLAKLLSNESLKSGIESYLNGELDLDLDLDAVLEAPEKEVDWSQYPAVDTDALTAVLAEVESALVKNDVPEIYTLDIGEIISPKLSEELGMEITVNCVVEIPVASLVMEAAEYVLYAYAGYAAEYDELYSMVPAGAQVVLTGAIQPGEDWEIAGIAIGEYVGYAFAAMDVQPLVYALVNDNTTFVSIQETNGDAEEMAEAVYAALDVTEIGHEWDDVVTDPTCTEDGYTTYTCLKCGETYTDDFTDAIGHAWGEWTDNGDGTHSRVCANDASHVETDEHDFTDGDCVCGAKKPAEDDNDEPSGGGGGGRKWHCPTCKSNTCHSKAFSDLDLDAWYHKYTDYVLCKGLMNGMGGDIFAPNATTTRAMIITTLYRMEGSPAVKGEIAYSDVAAGTWYTDAVIWGTENGIVKGYENATFDPMGSVTREQIAAIFNRYAAYKKVDTKKAAASLEAFADAAQVSAWAVEDMKWAVGNKFIVGRTDTTLVPNGATTRAEMATLLYRWANEIAK